MVKGARQLELSLQLHVCLNLCMSAESPPSPILTSFVAGYVVLLTMYLKCINNRTY
jgi:hypothetical protein